MESRAMSRMDMGLWIVAPTLPESLYRIHVLGAGSGARAPTWVE